MYSQELKDRVAKSRSWKLSNAECARRIGITLDEYLKIKKQLGFKSKKLKYTPDNTEKLNSESYDLDKGTGKIEKLVSVNPKTAEEIIEILGIDTNQWKLSQYWNKEKNDKWLISALVTRIAPKEEDYIKDVIKNFKPNYKPINVKYESNNTPVCGVLSLQDIHFGKLGNEDVDNDYFKALIHLCSQTNCIYKLDKLIYVLGGDILNMDTFSGTTTSGTVIENGMTAADTYKQAFDALYRGIRFLKTICKELHIVYIPGNHDRISSYHLAHALSKAIQEENIIWDVEYSERKVVMYGKNLFAFEHGDVSTKNSPVVYATEFPEEWGFTSYRTLYTGHYHKKKTTEYITDNEVHGFTTKILPSLSKIDYYHYHNKFTGNKRSAIIDIHNFVDGKIAEFVYNCN
jgi:hypothetical protein